MIVQDAPGNGLGELCRQGAKVDIRIGPRRNVDQSRQGQLFQQLAIAQPRGEQVDQLLLAEGAGADNAGLLVNRRTAWSTRLRVVRPIRWLRQGRQRFRW